MFNVSVLNDYKYSLLRVINHNCLLYRFVFRVLLQTNVQYVETKVCSVPVKTLRFISVYDSCHDLYAYHLCLVFDVVS